MSVLRNWSACYLSEVVRDLVDMLVNLRGWDEVEEPPELTQ